MQGAILVPEDRLHVCTTILLTLARVILIIDNSWTFALVAGVPHLLASMRLSAGQFPALTIFIVACLNSGRNDLLCVLVCHEPLHNCMI